jgi:hypothetical protein
VLWARTKEESIAVTLLPEEQINRTLECNGIFRTNPYSRTSSIYDSNFQHHIYFNSSYFLDQYNSLCIGYTCGDGVCDIGESIYTCAADCIPKTGFRLVKNGDLCQCDTNYSVAQWISAGKPLYVLHFTFDNETMWDSSHNGLNPSRDIGVLKKPSSYASVDGRKAHYFNDSAMYGDHYRALDLTGKNFSSFARIKALAPQLDEHQILLHLNGAGHFYYSIKDSKLYVSVRNESYAQRTFASIGTIDTEWHTVGIVYERPLLKIYIDGAKDSQHTVNLFSFQESGKYYVGAAGADSTYNFTGYIDDLFIADRALTEQQVFEYYATGHKTVSLTADAQCVIEMLPDAATTEQRCGDGICYPDESCSSCTVDCGNCAIIPSTHIGEERGSGGGVTLPFINPGEDNIIQSVGTEAEGNESHPVTIQDPLHDHGSSIGQHGEFQLTDEYASPSITSWLSYGTSVKISWLVGIVLIPLLFLAITRLTRKAHHNLLLNKYIEHHLEKGYTLEEIEKAINDRLQKDKYTKEDREHLEAYIKSCLAGHYPKDAIIQACDTVGWDEELIKEIFEELALRVNNEKI